MNSTLGSVVPLAMFIEGICWVIKMIDISNYDWQPWKFPGTWKFPGSWTFSSPWNFPGGLEIFRSWKFPAPLENSRILDISRPPGKFQGGPYLRSDTLWMRMRLKKKMRMKMKMEMRKRPKIRTMFKIILPSIAGARDLCDPNVPASACEYRTCKTLTRTHTQTSASPINLKFNLYKTSAANAEQIPASKPRLNFNI